MKKKVLSIALALVMSLTCLPTAVFAEDDHDHSEAGETEEIEEEITEDVNEEDEDDEIDVEAALVQAQINSLPDVENVTADDYDTVSDVYDAYLSLTDKQQSQIVGAGVFEELFGWFNSQTQTLEENGEDGGETTSTHTHFLCENESCNKLGGHTCSNTTFLPWESSTSLPTEGCYYLTTDVTVNNLIKITSGDLTLCLNGKKITLTNQDGIYKISGNTSISITDCLDTGEITSTKKTAFFKFDSWDSEVNTILNLYRGHISNGYNAILVDGISAKFYMYGGKISNCTRGVVGGGSSGPEAYIYGGQITENGTGVDCSNKLKLIVGGTANITGNSSYGENDNINAHQPEGITIKKDFDGLIGINASKVYQFMENNKIYVIEDDAKIDKIEEKILNDVPDKCTINHENGYGTVSCLHSDIFIYSTEASCRNCHEQVYASKPIDGGTKYYLSFSDALNDLKDGETLTVLQNVTLDSDILLNKNFTLNLNGKNISYSSENSKDITFDAPGKEVTIKDTASTKGTFGESIVVKNGTLTLSDGIKFAEGKKITVDGGKLKITNATIPGKTDEQDTINVNGGVAEISGGNICSLNVNPGGNAVLSGGEFVSIRIDTSDESSTRKLTALLYPGYAYKLLGNFNKWQDESDSKGISSGFHIGIFECVHENIIKSETSWDCIYCARKIMSSVLSGNSTTERFFVDISDTFAALDNGAVLTLNSESTDTETSITVKNKNFTFITNSKKLLNPITFENSTMTIGESSTNVTFGDLTFKNSTLNPNGLPIKATSLTFSGEGTSTLTSGFTGGSTFTNGINLNSTAKVTVNGKKATDLIDLVDTGYAFYKSDDTIFNEYRDSSSNISLTVKPHTCKNLVPLVGSDYKVCEDCGRKCYHGTYTESGVCTVCGFQMRASLTENGTTTFYEDLQDAVDAVKSGNSKASDSVVSVLKAETDAVNEGNMTKKITASGKTFTLNLRTDLYADVEFKNCNVSITSDGNNKEIKGKINLSGGEKDEVAMTINGVSFGKEFISNISYFSTLNIENVIFKKQVTIHHGITEFKNFDIQDDIYIDKGTITFNGGKFSNSQSGITIAGAKVSLSGITEAKASIQLGNDSEYYPVLTVGSDNCKFENTISADKLSTLEFYGNAELIQLQGGDALFKGGSISTIKTANYSPNRDREIEIESCSVGSLEIESCTSVSIALKNGSSFGNITITDNTDKSIADFIAEGYALANSTTNAIINANTKTISSVKIVPHETHNNVDETTGYCGCGKKMLITVKNDGENRRTYYYDINKAIEAVTENGTLTLLGDINIGFVTVNKKFTFNIAKCNVNGTRFTVGANGDVTLKGYYTGASAVEGNFNALIDVFGKLSIEGICVDSLAVETSTPSDVNLISGKYSSIIVRNGTLKDILGSDSAFKEGTQWINNAETMNITSNVTVEKTPISSKAYIDTASDEIEYGDNISLEAKIEETSLQGVTYKWTKTVGTETTTLGTAKTYTETHPNIGTAVYKCTITYDGFTRTVEKTVTVSPKTITEDMLTVNDLVFLPDAKLQNGDGEEQNASFTVTGLVKDTDYEVVSGDKGTDVDTYTLKIKGIGNYKGEISKTWKITPFELSDITVNIYDDERVYDGTTAVNIVGIQLIPKNNNSPLSSVDFTRKLSTNVTAKYSDASVGTDKDVEVKINLGSNYVYNNETIVTLTKKADILKANASSKTGAVLTVKNFCSNTYTFDLSTLLPDLANGCSFGDVSYEVTESTVSPIYYSKGDESIENGVLTIPIKYFETSTEGSIGKITIKVTTTNYTVSDIEIELKAVNKIPLTCIPVLNTSTVYYGDKISKITISGDVKDSISGNIVSGSFAWKNAEMVFDTIGDINVYWVFTPTDTMTYSSLEGEVTIKVEKAIPTGDPSYTAITSAGKTLSDANLGFGTLSVDEIPGALSWDDPTDTPVEQGKAYGWTYSPHDPDLYEVLKGSIVLWKKPSSSGGGGGGGAAAKPVSKNDGTLEIKTEVSNGTATIEVSDKQIEEAISGGKGSITIDVSSLDNVTEIKIPSRVIEKTKQDGNTSITIKLPTGSITLDKKALESLSGKEDVSVSVKTVASVELSSKETSALGNSVKVAVIVDMEIVEGKTVKSTFGNGKITVTIPYTPKSGENVSKLSVWYIRDDGTIEVKGGKYDPATQTFSFETEHLSRFILVNTENTKLFVDVPTNAYYLEAVNWASEARITGGIGNNMFAPDLSCTRAQIVSFLWRAAGCPEPKSSVNSFTDVKSNEYYYKAVLWAVEEGITSGTSESSFSPNDPCTRAQAVCFIYRYAKTLGKGFTGAWMFKLPFTDVEEWYFEAVAWCYKEGITGGTSETTFSPNDPCTRAQIVSFLYRMLNK